MKCQHVDFTCSNRYFELKQAPELKDAPGDRGHRADLAERANSFKREL